MKILVTGLNGIIGWNIFQRAARIYPETLGTYREHHRNLKGLNVTRLEYDSFTELEALFRSYDPEIIIHSWAICDLDLCEEMPEMAERINVQGARDIIKAAKAAKGLKRFVYISTDHVFDGEKGGYTEEDIPKPKHIYGHTKLKAEALVQSSGLPWQILRPGLTIGESLQGKKGPRDFLLTRIKAGKPTHYFIDEWRSPISAKELAKRAVEIACSEAGGVFHLAGSDVFSRYELAKKIAAESGLPGDQIFPRLRREDRWAKIRPKNISLKTIRSHR